VGPGLLSTSSSASSWVSSSPCSISASLLSAMAVTAMPEGMLDGERVGMAEVGIAEKRAGEEEVGIAEVGIAEKMAEMEEGLAGRQRAFVRKRTVMRRIFMFGAVNVRFWEVISSETGMTLLEFQI